MREDLTNAGDSSLFTAQQPSPEVQQYLLENPEFELNTAVAFLLDSYPQIKEGQTRWLIDGGAAVSLLVPAEGRVSRDVDIITRDAELAAEFANSRQFDAKDAKSWLEARQLPYSEESIEKIFTSRVEVNLDDRSVAVISPVLLAASKKLTYHSRLPREQDVLDGRLLNVDSSQVDAIIDGLAA